MIRIRLPLAKRASAQLALASAVSLAALTSALLAGCGGSDYEDAADAAAPDGGSTDGTVPSDGSADGAKVDAEAGRPDASDGAADALADALPDTSADTSADVGADTSADAGSDAATDARAETGVDAGVDASIDAGVDGAVDASIDAGFDATTDAGFDAGLDASLDAAIDAHVDAAIDAGGDSAAGSNILGAASSFAVLGGAAVAITGVTTTIVGDLGSSPGTNIATVPQGQPVGNIHAGDVIAGQAQAALTVAYNFLAGKPCLPANDRTGVDLGGKTLAPGTYCFNSSAGITGDLVLDAQGDPNAEWVFQVRSTLTTATISSVNVINGGSACNVYWQIGSSATLGTNTVFKGNIVALASITLVTGASIVPGRALARNGTVVLDSNAISKAACP